MAAWILIYALLFSLIGSALGEYCYYNYNSYFTYTYSLWCPFGCCGSGSYRYCCVTNVGYIVGLVIGIIVLLVIIISVSCCCVRQRRLRAAQTTTVVSGATTGAIITSTGMTASAPQYPMTAYNYGYTPENYQQPGMPSQYPTYLPNQQYPANQGFGYSNTDGAKFEPPSHLASPPPAYNSAVGVGLYDTVQST
ncbi:uncharacterized protein LOC129925600 [Biomphalaria glabrata]|uniref:Uncharacterized protein LOC129925600 n=1 Tax=Biomphalaria glabrata TaxID=6526 RepID=A0A9W3A1S9_BIOGL|nr:uncharacterized protein LOC129925600 [Biomphalaria glabrata]